MQSKLRQLVSNLGRLTHGCGIVGEVLALGSRMQAPSSTWKKYLIAQLALERAVCLVQSAHK
jgi:hypothetical protein